jgi:hypothetical protein
MGFPHYFPIAFPFGIFSHLLSKRGVHETRKRPVAALTLPAGKVDHFEWDDATPGFGVRLRAINLEPAGAAAKRFFVEATPGSGKGARRGPGRRRPLWSAYH